MSPARYPLGLMPKPRTPKSAPARKKRVSVLSVAMPVLIAAFILTASFFSLPLILAADVKLAQSSGFEGKAFPVTVDPSRKLIHTDPHVEALLATQPTSLPASVGNFHRAFEWLALQVAAMPAYQQIASAAGVPSLFVKISPGYRQEQVASAFGSQLGWTTKERAKFISTTKALEPDLLQGSTVPGVYFASINEPEGVATLVNDRFVAEIRSKYSTSTEEQIPLTDALTVASLIQRETGGWDDMRLISGIIWNRIFAGMKLQIDATLQYAEANQTTGKAGWWPSVEPKDKYIKSAYNTYQHEGLPPGPIANPSIAAVLAALNPTKTECMFYFHDSHGKFHCSKTYKEHVTMLKKYYGQGK